MTPYYSPIPPVRPKITWETIFLITLLIAILGVWELVRAEVTPLSIAQSQIGLGEIGGNNKGMYVRKYLNGQEGLPWCAGFISYCIKQAGISTKYTLRAKDYLKLGQVVNNPKVGGLIIFTRNGGGHIGIIEKITKETIITIEGNLGKFPSKIKRVTHKRGHIKNFLAFVRMKGR